MYRNLVLVNHNVVCVGSCLCFLAANLHKVAIIHVTTNKLVYVVVEKLRLCAAGIKVLEIPKPSEAWVVHVNSSKVLVALVDVYRVTELLICAATVKYSRFSIPVR